MDTFAILSRLEDHSWREIFLKHESEDDGEAESTPKEEDHKRGKGGTVMRGLQIVRGRFRCRISYEGIDLSDQEHSSGHEKEQPSIFAV